MNLISIASRSSLTILLTGVSLYVVPMPDAIAGENTFQTPSGNIRCLANNDFLFCVLNENTAKIPPTPKNCYGNWGHAFSLPRNGRVRRDCPTDTLNTGYSVLGYGQTWRSGEFTCRSEKTGLTCTNRINHGWHLSRERQQFF
jgi:hypothetical protein